MAQVSRAFRRAGEDDRPAIGWREEAGVIGKGRDRRAWDIRHEVAKPVFGDHLRNAGAQHLFLEVGGQLQRHELADGDAVGGLPGRDGGFEEPELGRAATARAGVHLG